MTVAMNRFALLDSEEGEEVATTVQGPKVSVKPANVKATVVVERPVKKEVAAKAAAPSAGADQDQDLPGAKGVKRNSKSAKYGAKRELDRRSVGGHRDSEKKLTSEKGSWGHEQSGQEMAEEVKEELKQADAIIDGQPAFGSAEGLEAGAAPAEEEGIPEESLKTLEQFLNEKTKVTSKFISRPANEGASQAEWKGLAKMEKEEQKGLFVELMVDKTAKKAATANGNGNAKAKTTPAKVAIPVGFHSGKRESAAPRPPFKKEGMTDARRGDSAGARGGRGGARGGFTGPSRGGYAGGEHAAKPAAPAPKRSVNVDDTQAFPSLA